MKIKEQDLKVLKKVADKAGEYQWRPLMPGSRYYKIIEFPIEAEEKTGAFFSEVFNGITIIVGTYLSRFYYEEDNYTWEKKCYATIISTKNNIFNSIAFITAEDVESMNRKVKLFKIPTFSEIEYFEDNPIIHLYDQVKRQVSGIDNLYNEFLEEE